MIIVSALFLNLSLSLTDRDRESLTITTPKSNDIELKILTFPNAFERERLVVLTKFMFLSVIACFPIVDDL